MSGELSAALAHETIRESNPPPGVLWCVSDRSARIAWRTTDHKRALADVPLRGVPLHVAAPELLRALDVARSTVARRAAPSP